MIFLVYGNTTMAKRSTPKNAYRDSVLNLIYTYRARLDTAGIHHVNGFAYSKFQVHTNRRNATLMLVPTMYVVARGAGRQFVSENYTKVSISKEGKPSFHRLLNISTIPRRHDIMTPLMKYMTPNIYGENLFEQNILSPFHRNNRRFYSYKITPLAYDKAQLYAYPRLKNTQIVETKAIVDTKTGKIEIADFEGEYDMTRFYISILMGNEEGIRSILPKKCDLKANFRFMGNRITANYTTYFHLPQALPDTLYNLEDTATMAKVRPVPLTKKEQDIYNRYFDSRAKNDSIHRSMGKQKDFVKDVLWDVIGDNMLNRISQNFGKESKGYFRLSPILNPLYMGYSHSKGVIYKFDLRGSYAFNSDMQLSLRFKGGYSFRDHQFYISIPVSLNYSQKHNGYLTAEIGNGNRINNNMVARRILGISMEKDSTTWVPEGNFTEFKDYYYRLSNHWSINSHIGHEIGLVVHHREAVFPEFYQKYDYPTAYTSVAPSLAIEWQPWGSKGPFVKIDYERSIKGLFGANIDYERVEIDAQAILKASRRRLYSLRLGTGFYTRKGDHWDFVDYTNFRDNNIPGGWNDDWSGGFELLNSEWYNASDYYVRANVSYESPIMLTAWLPWVGRFVESERFYVNALTVRRLYPYTEWGYGCTTRLISMGVFTSFRNWKFDGVGFRFGFELFRHW